MNVSIELQVEKDDVTYESNTTSNEGRKSRNTVHGSSASGIGNWGTSGSWYSDNTGGSDRGRSNTGGHGSAVGRARIDGNGP